ncbi:MAG: AraC family transcriptional regulator [Ruminococcaceae bacterium]|nr:AraC family transcriptional regulator [Oscillospiraceae bacterium]
MAELRKLPIIYDKVLSPMFNDLSRFYYPVAVRYVKYTKHFLGEYHRHDFPQVWYCVSGTYIHAVGDEDYICGPGSVVIVPPGVFHCYEISSDKPVELIALEGTFFFFKETQSAMRASIIANMFCNQFSDELGFAPPRFVTLSGDEKTQADKLLSDLCKKDYTRNIPNIDNVHKKIGDFFSMPTFALTTAQRKRAECFILNKLSPIMDAILYMNENYAKKIHTEELLRISSLCHTDFFRLMKKTVGTTYALYLQMLRVKRAQIMITFSTFSFSYIANKCGFGSQSYLGRLFKEYYGLTMHEERKKRNSLVDQFPFMIMTHEFWERTNIE